MPAERCRRCSYPRSGFIEGVPTSDGCPNCRSWPSEPDRVLACAQFDGAIADLVHATKFAGKRRLARLLGHRIGTSRLLREDLEQVDALVAVSLHPTRLRERGYNQSLCIAQVMSEALGKPLIPDLVMRSRTMQQQAMLDGEARLDNVRDAFHDPRQNSSRVTHRLG